jgi:hypothetical protein
MARGACPDRAALPCFGAVLIVPVGLPAPGAGLEQMMSRLIALSSAAEVNRCSQSALAALINNAVPAISDLTIFDTRIAQVRAV